MRNGIWETTDIGTAAYVFMRKRLRIHSATRQRSGQFSFRFLDPDGVGDELKIEYANSEFRDYDAAVRTLKKICYGPPR